MGNRKSYLYNIAKFYTFQTFDHIMFGYCLGANKGYLEGLKKALPTLDVDKAPNIGLNRSIELFLEAFNLCEDVYCHETARLQYYRIMKALRDKEMGEAEPIDDEEEEPK